MRGLLESGCSLVVGLLAAGDVPFGTRAWAFDLLDPEAGTARLLLGAGELARVDRSREDLAGASIAVTAADVRTLRSVQVKGTLLGIEDATADDVERCRRHQEGFFGAVIEVDGTPHEVLERLVPVDLVAARLRVEDAYDQTPGPRAGASVASTS